MHTLKSIEQITDKELHAEIAKTLNQLKKKDPPEYERRKAQLDALDTAERVQIMYKLIQLKQISPADYRACINQIKQHINSNN